VPVAREKLPEIERASKKEKDPHEDLVTAGPPMHRLTSEGGSN
jgi:hypothetical protein